MQETAAAENCELLLNIVGKWSCERCIGMRQHFFSSVAGVMMTATRSVVICVKRLS